MCWPSHKKILVLIALFFCAAAVVDRTYYIYLGLDISATHDDILAAYEEKKLKIEGLEDEEEKSKKLRLLEEGI